MSKPCLPLQQLGLQHYRHLSTYFVTPFRNLLVNIEGCHNLWIGQILCDGSRHTHLINGQVRIWRDDGTSWEVDTFTHEVTTDTSLLGFQTLWDGFQRATRFLGGLVWYGGKRDEIELLLMDNSYIFYYLVVTFAQIQFIGGYQNINEMDNKNA